MIGNHDMYSGGHGYFDLISKDGDEDSEDGDGGTERVQSGRDFSHQNGTSFFRIANEHWQIIGLDSAYVDNDLDERQLPEVNEWLGLSGEDSPGQGGVRPRTILLSHHQLGSARSQAGTSSAIRAKTAAAREAGRVHAWFWGHEHRAFVYEEYLGVRFPVCIGNGGMPELLSGTVTLSSVFQTFTGWLARLRASVSGRLGAGAADRVRAVVGAGRPSRAELGEARLCRDRHRRGGRNGGLLRRRRHHARDRVVRRLSAGPRPRFAARIVHRVEPPSHPALPEPLQPVRKPVDLQRAHRVGAQSARAAARLPRHRDRQRQRAARRRRRGAGLGQRRPLLLRRRLGDRALDPARRLGHLAEPARLGEQRPDDVLLLRRRARGAARVRRRRAARAPPPRPAGAGGARRHGAADRDLPGLQRRRRRGRRLGGGDVDRHRLRAGDAGAGRAALPRPPARLHADDHRRRRRRRPAGHRRRLQRPSRPRAAADRRRRLRRDPARPRAAHQAGPRLLPARRGRLGGAVRIRRRAGGARARGGTDHLGLSRRGAKSSSGRRGSSAASASSRRPSSPARPARGCRRRSRPTRGCWRSTTRGPATSSCRCSPSPTSASRSTAASSPRPTRRR